MIKIDNLNYSVNDKNIIRDISLNFEKGKFYGILGPNGSGKTTLLDLTLGFIEKNSGNISVINKDLTAYSKKELAKTAAYVPQTFDISFQFSVEEILEMGRYPHKNKFKKSKHNDSEIINNIISELNLYELLNKSITDLSGGERQRVVIAKALVQNTPILFLDESTSNLDQYYTHEILKKIKNRVKNQNLTVISVFHDFSLVSLYCDEVIFLKEGAISAKGDTETTLTSDNIMKVFNVKSNVITNGDKKFVIPYL